MWSSKELAAEVEAILKDKALDHWSIVLYNDDVNTFDWVIDCLVKYCGHDLIQAEQCAYFVHFKGKYAVQQGTRSILAPMREQLTDRGINATIE